MNEQTKQKIERTITEHRKKEEFYRNHNKTGCNTGACNYHRAYADALEDIIIGLYEV